MYDTVWVWIVQRGGLLSGGDAKAKVYPARLEPDVAEQKREGAVAVVDLVGFKKNAE